jgi:hypothetical protein
LSWHDIIDYVYKAVVLAAVGYLFHLMRYRYNTQIEILKATQVKDYIENISKFKQFYEMTIAKREKEIENLKVEIDKIKNKLPTDYSMVETINLLDKFKDNMIERDKESWEDFFDMDISAASLWAQFNTKETSEKEFKELAKKYKMLKRSDNKSL